MTALLILLAVVFFAAGYIACHCDMTRRSRWDGVTERRKTNTRSSLS